MVSLFSVLPTFPSQNPVKIHHPPEAAAIHLKTNLILSRYCIYSVTPHISQGEGQSP